MGEKNALRRVVLLALGLLLTAAVLFGCGRDENQEALKKISRELSLDLPDGELLTAEDGHGGFHGDGLFFAAVRFADGTMEERLKADGHWQAFPANETVQALLYGYEFTDGRYGPYLTDGDGTPLIPAVENGYYWLRDRQVIDGQASGADILHRGSFNFTIGVYDSDTGILYCCKMDT